MGWLGSRRWLALVVTGSVTATGVACSVGNEDDPPEPLIIAPAPAPAPAEASARLDLDIPLDPSGLFVFSQWPRACDLLTEAELTAMVPQVTAVEHTAGDQDFVFVDSGRTVTVTDAACTYGLHLPDGLSVQEVPPATIVVRVEAAGSPEAVDQNFSAVGEAIEVPSGECHAGTDLFTVSCRQGQVAFSITTVFPDPRVENGSWTVSYQVDGETTTFTGPTGADDEAREARREAEEFLRDALTVELAKTVLAKI